LALAILSAFVDARRAALPASRTSVPTVPRDASPLYEPVYCDNFGQAANRRTPACAPDFSNRFRTAILQTRMAPVERNG
jgi:hypothetical protein